MLDELKQLDPETFQLIDIKNPRRVERALEIIKLTKTKLSLLKQKPSGGAVVVIMIGAIYLAHMDWFADLRKLFTSEQIFLFIIGLYFTIRGNN